MDSREIDQATKELWATYGKLPFKERREIIGLKEDVLRKRWISYLKETYGDGIYPGALGLIYQKAWSDGHSAGFQEVEYFFEDLCNFYRELRELDSWAQS